MALETGISSVRLLKRCYSGVQPGAMVLLSTYQRSECEGESITPVNHAALWRS